VHREQIIEGARVETFGIGRIEQALDAFRDYSPSRSGVRLPQ
jgi:hypothetical protein